MAAFTGSLNTNEMYNSIYNMLRLAYIYANNLGGLDDSLANKYRTDGGQYSDQSIYTDMDIIYSRVWDPDDTNVLAPEAVVKPVQQTIVTDKFRQIGLYTDEYLSKRAWMDAAKYDEFRSVVQKQVSDTKKVFEQKLVDTFVGGVQNGGAQDVTLTLPTDTDAEAQNRLQAQAIATKTGDLFVELGDSTDKYNKNGFTKSFKPEDFDIIWNSKYYNKMLFTDLTTIFHNDNLLKKGHIMPTRYFNSFALGEKKNADGTTVISRREYFIPVNGSGAYAASGPNVKHVFPGDLLPSGTPIQSTGADTFANITTTINGKSRTVKVCTSAFAAVLQPKVICKLVHKDAIKYMSSFETGTEFWNPKNLSTNRYLTWAYAEPETLDGYPIITLIEG